MTGDRWARTQRLFDAARRLPAADRSNHLDAACAGDDDLRRAVEELLAHATPDDSFLAIGTAGSDPDTLAGAGGDDEASRVARGAPDVGRRVGHFHLRSVIASGGFGTVYLAAQDEPRRHVALKLMKPGVASRSALRRFQFEAQLLARLRHPGIAQIYESGTHDDGHGGVPYFAMEYVPGALSLTEYATQRKLDTRARLTLFAEVCDAVAHGHQKGIIHRDLKPSNILVDSSGRPKIIDFGVARATDSDMAVTTLQTDLRQIIGTLQYMSPEQCGNDALDIDSSSDVYALGVVLYELLCDRVPYDVSGSPLPAAIDTIRTCEPARPSTMDRALRGDVETIVLKALDKERSRRYRTAADLGDDVLRYLRDEPIIARAPGVLDAMRRFARKHTAAAVAIGGAFAVLAVGLAVAASMWAVTVMEQERSAGLAADLWRSQSAPAPAVWADAEAESKAAIAREHAAQAGAAADRGQPGVAAESYMLALGALSEARSHHDLAIPRLIDSGVELARQGKPAEAMAIVRRLEAIGVSDEGLGSLLLEISVQRFIESLVVMPAGEFTMGSPFPSQNPPHQVTIRRPFLMSSTEVTQGAFLAVMGHNPAAFPGDLDRPVESVTWHAALEFCNRLSERAGRSPRYEIQVVSRTEDGGIREARTTLVAGNGYRLPTEAEWEYGCGAGTETAYNWGTTVDSLVIDEHIWYSRNSDGVTHPVARKKANGFGLYDMHGNVQEWCEDVWHRNYEGAPIDGAAWMSSDGVENRVVRGGSWRLSAKLCGTRWRASYNQSYKNSNLGFRVCLDSD